MKPARSVLIAVCLAALAFAGCISSGDDPVDAPSEAGASEAEATDTTGALQGKVANAALESLEGADVAAVLDGNVAAETETDAQGRYAFSGLAPGKYIVQATAILHKNAARSVTIEAGKVASLDLMLERIGAMGTDVVGDEFRGLMSVGAEARHPALAEAGSPTSGLSMTWAAGDENHRVSFDFDVLPERLETILVEVYWNNPNVGLRGNIWYKPNCNPGPCDPEHEFAQEAGFGTITMRVDRPEEGWPAFTAEKEELTIYMWTYSTEEQPVVLAYQQPYDVYYELWYGSGAPEDRVVRPDN